MIMIIIRNYEAELDLLTMGITMNKGLSVKRFKV